MKTFAKMIVAVIVAFVTMCLLIVADMPDNIVIPAYFFVGIILCLAWGVFDVEKRNDVKHTSIKDATRNYGQAAVFIGTACLFMGTLTECDELCDDLWHYGQQAEVRELTGEETFNVI